MLGATLGVGGTESVTRLTSAGGKAALPKTQQKSLLSGWWVEQPINPNGDFSQGSQFWKGGLVGTTDARNVTAGINVIQNDHGEVWIDNPDLTAYANTALMQASGGLSGLVQQAGIPLTQWFFSSHHLMLEADVRVDYDEPYGEDSWSRVAIATWIQRIDPVISSGGTVYFEIKSNLYTKLYTEYDVYRRNVQFLGYNALDLGSNVNEYPADQLPIGYWKPYKIDLNELIMNGYNELGGWGKQNLDVALLSAWYLVPEAKGSRLQASWRRIKIYEPQ